MSTFDNIKYLVQFVLRRRRLLFLPFLLMIPVSIAFALLMTPRYQARSLAQFQEIEVENPLARAPIANGERMQDRISSFRALIRSDAVLGPAVDADPDVDASLSRAERVRRLRDALSVESVGSNLIEFRLSGGPALGLGARLDRIMTNFLEIYKQVAPQKSGARLLLIDPPRDPDKPVTGRSVIALLGILSGLVVGVVLAVTAEAMDRRIRTPADLRRIPDMPPVLRLPRLIAPPPRGAAPKRQTSPLLRRVLQTTLPALLLGIAYLALKDQDIPAAATEIIERIRQSGMPKWPLQPADGPRTDAALHERGG